MIAAARGPSTAFAAEVANGAKALAFALVAARRRRAAANAPPIPIADQRGALRERWLPNSLRACRGVESVESGTYSGFTFRLRKVTS